MELLAMAGAVIGAVAVLNLLLTFGVICRLREHADLLADSSSALRGAPTMIDVGLRRRFVSVLVTGESMVPLLREGQRVLVRRGGLAAVQRGDLVVFAVASVRERLPGDPPWMVKRAIAFAGDPVPYESVPSAAYHGNDRVPEGNLIVRGDNETRSLDSRRMGSIDGRALLGVVVRELPS